MSFACKSVIRMYLDREVVAGVDELDQERELSAGLCIYLLTEKRALLLGSKFCDGLSCKRTFSHY